MQYPDVWCQHPDCMVTGCPSQQTLIHGKAHIRMTDTSKNICVWPACNEWLRETLAANGDHIGSAIVSLCPAAQRSPNALLHIVTLCPVHMEKFMACPSVDIGQRERW